MKSCKVFGTFISVILVLATSIAIASGQDDPAAYRLITGDAEDSPSSVNGMGVAQSDDVGCCDTGCDKSCCCPRWTATADFIIFDRIGTSSQTLVSRISRISRDTQLTTGTEALNSNDFRQGFHGGPRVGLIRHGDCCYDIELLYFQIDGWSSSRRVDPDNNNLVFSLPDNINYSTPYPMIPYPMQFDYSSKLYNAEMNVRWNPCDRVTMLAGFRWVELRENLDGGEITPLLAPFWNTTTTNNLYGFQIGADTKLWERCRFSIDGLVKAGVFDNHAEHRSTIPFGTDVSVSDSTNHTAFLGEVGLQAKYQVTCNLTLRAGYEAIWIDGVALAPGQIQETRFRTEETGINTNGGVFYHGATAGFEYSF